jgi:hypothetical protein
VLAYLGLSLFCLGYPDQALARSDAAIAEARKLAHPPSLAVSLALGARLLSLIRDNAVRGGWVDELVAVTTDQGFPYWGSVGTILRGWVKAKNGDVAEGTSFMRSGLAAYRATGAELWIPHYIALLVGAHLIAGQVEEGLVLLGEALQVVERTEERWFAAELHRHKGWLLLQQGHAKAAEDLYRKARSSSRSSSVAPHPAARHRPPGSEPDAMTILTASLQRLLAGTSRFRRRAHLASAPASADTTSRIGPQSGCRRRQPRPIRNHRRHSALSDTRKVVPRRSRLSHQIPIDGEPLAASRGFVHRRLSDAGPNPVDRSRRAGIRNPSRLEPTDCRLANGGNRRIWTFPSVPEKPAMGRQWGKAHAQNAKNPAGRAAERGVGVMSQ